MSSLFESIKVINTVDSLAEKDTIIHRIHPLAKMITTMIYIIITVSVDKYNINNLLALFLYPIIMLQILKIPKMYILKRILLVLPFSIMAGVFNIFLDRESAVEIMNISISYGVISFTSLLLKTVLTVISVIILVSTTSMNKIFNELQRLKVPNIIITQFMFTYKYISLVISEGKNMYLSYNLRKGEEKGIHIKHIGMFLGQLLLRCFDRAERIYLAMKCRGYDGSNIFCSKDKIKAIDIMYIVSLSIIFGILGFLNIFEIIGRVLGA